jgi:MFS transporter, DHA2 family, multidrug resistance protein
MSRFATRARGAMLANVTMSRPAVAARVLATQHMLAARGLDPAAAQQAAPQMIDGLMRQQAMVLSFERLFMICGIAFLCVLPLVLLLRMPKNAEKIEVHMEM